VPKGQANSEIALASGSFPLQLSRLTPVAGMGAAEGVDTAVDKPLPATAKPYREELHNEPLATAAA